MRDKLQVTAARKKALNGVINKITFSAVDNVKSTFAYLHVLLFDSWSEPLMYMLNIPYPQFCKFYNLSSQRRVSRFLYTARLVIY